MKKKIIGILICMIFILSANTGISYSFEKTQTKFDGPTVVINSPEDGAILNNPQIVVEGYASGMGIKRINYAILYAGGGMYSSSFDIDPPTEYYEFSIDFEIVEGSDGNTITVTAVDVEDNEGSDSITVFYESGEDDTEPPIVTITYPSDGYESSEPDIYVIAEGSDNVGIIGFGIIHEWEDGFEDTGLIELTDPSEFITINESITLREGWNSLEVYMQDLSSNQGYDDIEIFWVFFGLHIESKFQPEQVVYQHDPLYPPDDLIGGPCDYTARLGMVVGKNTYLFGHPYADRDHIDMTCCNNYLYDVTFQYVLKIYPDGKEIWRSDNITVRAGETKTSTFNAPLQCPGNRFQWERWSDNVKTKPGRIELTIEPDHTGGVSPCDCYRVVVDVVLHKTHDLKVLFVPFTFGDGPAFPPDMQIPPQGGTAFDVWRWDTLEPWWLGIYPVREGGLKTYRNWLGNLQKNLTTGGNTVSNSSTFSALTRAEQLRIWNQMFTASAALAWMRLYDRIVWLLHPDILHLNKVGGGTDYGNGWGFVAAPGDNNKYGVLVNWSTRTKTAPHEITHTYGVVDSYPAPSFADGYWVNQKIDIINRRDLMYYTHPIADSWIKKPNFKSLLDRFTQHRDPIVLGISGYIDMDNNVELNPWYKLDDGNIDLEWDTLGDYLIKAYDSNGDLLETAGFTVSFSIFGENLGEIPIDESAFAFRVEWIDGIKRVDIVETGSGDILASRTVSSNAPQVTITSPQPNEEVEQEPYEIEWDGSDADGDILTATVWISNSSGEGWFPLDMDVTGDSTSVDFTDLPQDNYQINVVVTDGINTAEDTTSFSLPKSIEKGFVGEQLFITNWDDRALNLWLSFLKNYPRMFSLLQQILSIS